MTETAPITKEKTKQTLASMYKVIMHNDDYTPMDFVVNVLTDIYKKNEAQANGLMLKIHNEGCAIVGIYTREIAETKQEMTHQAAQKEGYPLRCTIEPETPVNKISFN